MFARWISLCCLGVSALTLAVASSAAAQECEDNGDCPKGFTCASSGTTSDIDCASQPACAPDDKDCADKEAEPCNVEPSKEYKQCVPGKCDDDTDCADGMICYAYESKACTDEAPPQACAEGEECPAYDAGSTSCETVKTDAVCIPRYFAPCEKAADCGEGFTCDAQKSCSCSGSSGGADPGSAGEGLPPAADAGAKDAREAGDDACECVIDEDAPKSCDIEEIDCSDASDCPESWTCETYSKSGGDVACASSDSGPDGGVDFDCGIDAAMADSEELKRCMPPYVNLFARDSDSSSDGSGLDKGGENEATGGGMGAPHADGDDNGDAGTGAGEEEDDGCSVSRVGGKHDADHAWLAALGLVGLALVTRRKSRLSRSVN